MGNQESQSIDKTGAIVKVNLSFNTIPQYRFGVTVKTEKDLIIIFKDSSYIIVTEDLEMTVEYICATYLVCEKITTIGEMIKLFKEGTFDNAFISVSN